MEPATTPLQWEILTRGEPPSTFESLYSITETVEIIARLEHLVDSIDLKGTRSEEKWEGAKETDKKHKDELLPILDKIKLLCSPGREWEEPIPEQHALREEKARVEGKRVLHIRGTEQNWRFNFFPKVLIDDIVRTLNDDSNGDFKKFVEHDVRNNFYFLLPDLLGLFLSKLGIAPPQATVQNFYIPILALYARWVGVMLGGESTALSEEQIGEFEPDPDFNSKVVVQDDKHKSEQPNMYQITWTKAKEGSGEPHLFSLGASIGGYYGNLGKRNYGGLVRKARWDVCDRDKELANIVSEWKWPHTKQKQVKTMVWKWAKDGGSMDSYRYGNCAETYTFLHLLSNRTLEEKNRTMGISLSAKGTTLNPHFDKKTPDLQIEREYNYDHITRQRENKPSRDFFAPLCANCAHMGKFYNANLKQFEPLYHLPLSS